MNNYLFQKKKQSIAGSLSDTDSDSDMAALHHHRLTQAPQTPYQGFIVQRNELSL
jgi:hypothetical protein